MSKKGTVSHGSEQGTHGQQVKGDFNEMTQVGAASQ